MEELTPGAIYAERDNFVATTKLVYKPNSKLFTIFELNGSTTPNLKYFLTLLKNEIRKNRLKLTILIDSD